jgi:hypothetical protein
MPFYFISVGDEEIALRVCESTRWDAVSSAISYIKAARLPVEARHCARVGASKEGWWEFVDEQRTLISF